MDAGKVRWHWIIGCLVVGAGLIGFAGYSESRWEWSGVAPSALVSIGAAMGLAGVLFLLERKFVSAIGPVIGQVATEAAEEVVERKTEALDRRLSDLSDEVAQRRAEQSEADLATVEALETVSYATVTQSLRAANNLAALADGIATVHASADPLGLRLQFKWGSRIDNTDWGTPQKTKPSLLIVGIAPQSVNERDARYVLEVEWRKDSDPADVGAAIDSGLQRLGWWSGPDTFDWALTIQNLKKTLAVAIASRKAEDGAWHLSGAIYELVGDDIAVTEAGIEAPDRGYLLSEAQFPDLADAMRSTSIVEIKPFEPEIPEWANASEWEHALAVARERFPIRH